MDEAKYRDAETRLWESVGIEPVEHLITLDSTGTAVRVQEVGEGEPVLFIHGGPNAGSTWAGLLEHFNGYRSLLVDRPGTGLSDPYTITDLEAFTARFVEDVLVGLHVERADVVGSSFGGYLALNSAASTPHRIRRMVQMACPAFVPGMLTPTFMRLMTVGPIRKLLNALPPNEKVGRSILRQIGHGASLDAGKIPQAFFDWYLALQKHTDTMRHDGDMIGSAGSFRKGLDPSYTIPDSLLAAVETPALFLWGADDAFGDEAVAANVVSLMPDAELRMIPDAGHLPWLDDPIGMAGATAGFFSATG